VHSGSQRSPLNRPGEMPSAFPPLFFLLLLPPEPIQRVRRHLSSLLACAVLRHSERAICRDTTVAFCLGLGQRGPCQAARQNWAPVPRWVRAYTHKHTHTHTHRETLLARKNRHQTHSICNLLLHRETLEWLSGSALLLCVGVWVCVCVCVCVCVLPIDDTLVVGYEK